MTLSPRAPTVKTESERLQSGSTRPIHTVVAGLPRRRFPGLQAVCSAARKEVGLMLQVGRTMVQFELPAHDGSMAHSDQLAGRPYLLFFYPKAATPG